MKQSFYLLTFALLSLFMPACSYDEISESFIPKEESSFAKDYLARLRAQEYDYVKSMLSPEIASQVNDELLEKMANHFRPGEPKSVKIIGSHVNIHNGQWRGNFTFEYEFESGWNLANTALKKVGNGYEVIGLNVYQTAASQKEINAFNLSSKSVTQYSVFILAIAVPIFILCTLIVCIRTPIPRKKWLWIVFILFGIGAIQVNWTNGAYGFQLISFQLFGASAISAGPGAPYVLSVSVPLGALIFWLKRKKFILESSLTEKPEQQSDDVSGG